MDTKKTTASGNPVALNEPPILIMQTAFLGDVLLTIPLLRRVRQLRPQSPLILVAREGVGRVIRDLELVDEVHEVRKKDKASYKAVQDRLRSSVFEWILCPHESFTSAIFCWRIPARLKIGYEKPWNFPFFGERIVKDRRLPEALRLLSLLKKRDLEMANWIEEAKHQNLNQSDPQGRLAPVPPWASLSLRERLRHRPSPFPAGQRTVCVFPGSVWPTKQWGEHGFADLGHRLVAEGYEVYWMGSKDEMPATKRLEAAVKGSRSVAGHLSLIQSLVLLSHSRLAVSNDSAGQHLAAVAGTPTVSIFGPTVPGQGFRPWSSQAVVAELKEIACRPCGAHGHKLCPRGHHDCMKRLPPALVHQRVHQILSKI